MIKIIIAIDSKQHLQNCEPWTRVVILSSFTLNFDFRLYFSLSSSCIDNSTQFTDTNSVYISKIDGGNDDKTIQNNYFGPLVHFAQRIITINNFYNSDQSAHVTWGSQTYKSYCQLSIAYTFVSR